MNLVTDARAGRRPSAHLALRRGSRARGDSENTEWRNSSCRVPSASYTYAAQQQETYFKQVAKQQCSTYLYDKSKVPNSARPLPLIQVTRENNRRTSISSPLRFTRTVSTDSIDSLEKRCIQELKVQRMMETERPRLLSQTSMNVVGGRQQQLVKRQLSYNPKQESPNESTLPVQQQQSLTNSLSAGHRLQSIGRSKTDPGNEKQQSSDGSPVNGSATTKCIHAQASLRRSPPSLSMPVTESNRRPELTMKRSTPDLVLDGVLRCRSLSEAIGLSVYQQRLLIQCWPNIYSTGMNAPFANNLYSTLCNKNAKAKQLMQKADGVAVFSQAVDCTAMHTKLTLELIDSIIRNLDAQPEPIIAYLNEVGQCHRSLRSEGINTAWDDLGDSMLQGVCKNDLVRKHKELRRAWLALIAFICDNIKQGQTLFVRASPSVEISPLSIN